MSPDSRCPFCKAVSNPGAAWGDRLIWTFPHSFAVLGPWQFFTGYCLLISRDHASELSRLGPTRTAYLNEMAVLAEAIEACFQPHKVNYELLGNQVPHLHWHLFPRYADDPDRLRPVWFALERANEDGSEKVRLETGRLPRDEIAKRLRDWLGK